MSLGQSSTKKVKNPRLVGVEGKFDMFLSLANFG
jgi:hypothetical protein